VHAHAQTLCMPMHKHYIIMLQNRQMFQTTDLAGGSPKAACCKTVRSRPCRVKPLCLISIDKQVANLAGCRLVSAEPHARHYIRCWFLVYNYNLQAAKHIQNSYKNFKNICKNLSKDSCRLQICNANQPHKS
jgi:hypothetical protein